MEANQDSTSRQMNPSSGNGTQNNIQRDQRYLQGNASQPSSTNSAQMNNMPGFSGLGATGYQVVRNQQSLPNTGGINLASIGEERHTFNLRGELRTSSDDPSDINIINDQQEVSIDDSQEENVRDAAHAIEELQRAQADTLTDDEFEDSSQMSGGVELSN